MKINEIELITGLSKANIRFYESEGLLTPERDENGYRNYSDADINRIKTIIVLRKIGMPVQKIRDVFDNKISLQDGLDNDIKMLSEKISELSGALEICKEIKSMNVNVESLDADYYLNKISEREAEGASFADIAGDIISFQLDALNLDQGGLMYTGRKSDPLRKRIMISSLTVAAVAAVEAILYSVSNSDFRVGIMNLFIMLAIDVSVSFAAFLISKKNRKAAYALIKLLRVIWPIIFACYGIRSLLDLSKW